MLCRVYVNIMDKRVLTAEKILGNAEEIIKEINSSESDLQIILNFKLRRDSQPYNITQLYKVYLLMKGIVSISLSKDDDAIDAYLECIEEEKEFDPRIL